MKKTYSAKPQEVDRQWWIIDAKDQVLGRLASEVASLLRGKNKPQFTTHIDTGDFVVIINADAIRVTGKKLSQKKYARHTGHPGGFRSITMENLMDKHPERVIEKAVWGMLPHTSLGRRQITKLKVYAGEAHEHQAQQPKPYALVSSGDNQ